MTDSGSEDEQQQPLIKLVFKLTTQNHVLEVPQNATIKKVKAKLSTVINQPAETICLIFSGKILKDHENLQTHDIKDGMAVHLVIRKAAAGAGTRQPTAAASAGSTPSPRPASAAGAGAGATPGGLPTPQRNSLIPEGMQQMLNTPMMQNLMSNPEFLRSIFMGNEQMQQLIRQNPELGHIINDPDVMRQTLEMMRNPTAFNEMLRNHDQAIRNLQGIPGGEAALHRIYNEVQEPLLNNVGRMARNPYASGANAEGNTTAESRSQRAGVENAEALPNPWGGGGSAGGTTGSTGAEGAAAGTAGSGAATGGAPGGAAGLLGGMDFSSVMQNPAFQSMAQSLMSNPDAMRQMMTPEVMQQARSFLGNSGLPMPNEGDLGRVMDHISGLMRDPQTASALTNPRVLEAMQNIQRSLDVIRTEAPQLFSGDSSIQSLSSLFGGLGGGVAPPAATPAAGAAATAPASGAAPAGAGAGATAPGTPSAAQLSDMFNLFANLQSGAQQRDTAASNLPPEERYREQLDQLANMGFPNREANLRAILDAGGDVTRAIDRLLNQ